MDSSNYLYPTDKSIELDINYINKEVTLIKQVTQMGAYHDKMGKKLILK